MSKPILIVEDEPMQQHMVQTLLQRKLGFGSRVAPNGREALEILAQDEAQEIKLVILDLNMPVMGGMETLEIVRQKYPSLPVILLTGSKDVDAAVQAMKIGAVDYINKPFEGERLIFTVQNALRMSSLSKEVKRLKTEKEGLFTFAQLIGSEGGLAEAVALARKAASVDIPVLITGETGTGKEMLAMAIHGESVRAGKPFVAVNCGAIPANLVESILFGHEKGSFTGAIEKSIGKFREAEGGTIFLDEVGELPLDTQVKLLRALQQKEVEPVGAARAVPVNIRVISATNRDLEKSVKQGLFREDLFFRLNVLRIALPPLRRRSQDIQALARHFIDRYCATYNVIPKDLSIDSIRILASHDWPGNVRELENVISRAMTLCEGPLLDVQDLGQTRAMPAPAHHAHSASAIEILSESGAFKTMESIELEAMQSALRHFKQNVTQAAKALGIAKSTFYKKMKTGGSEGLPGDSQ